MTGDTDRRATRGPRGIAVGDGSFKGEVVGESFYQDNLQRIDAALTARGEGREFAVDLVPDPNNPHDKHAVSVEMEGLMLGHIPRSYNWELLAAMDGQLGGRGPILVQARLVGGRGARSSIGLYLDITDDLEIVSTEK
ncbi:MAG: HIRAN domain-containing protein [Pseudomonadota bacterium]